MFTPSDKPFSIARGLVTQLVITAGAFVLVFGWFGCVGGLSMVLPADIRPFSFSLGAIGLMPLILVGGLALGLFNRWRIRRHLDAAMDPLGLDGSGLGLLGAQYHGTVAGRQVDALLVKGPLFQLWVGADSGTRAAIAPSNALRTAVAGAVGQPVIDTSDLAGLEQLEVRGNDADWVRGVLDDDPVSQALGRVVESEGIAAVRNVVIAPKALLLTLHRVGIGGITAERMKAWTDDLSVVARAIDAAPTPAQVIEERALERLTRENPSGMQRRVAVVVLLFTFGLVAAMMAIALVAVLVSL